MIVLKFVVILICFAQEPQAKETSDAELATEILNIGDQLYWACVSVSAFINRALARNESIPNVPNRVITNDDVKYLLYTKKNPTEPQNLTVSNSSAIFASNYDWSKLTVLYIPGALDASDGPARQLSSKILPSMDVNVIITNWDSYSFFNATYTVSRTVPLLASICVRFIRQLFSMGARASQMYLIGYSSGGQAVGFIGKQIPNIGRILAVDPAAPCYTYRPPQEKLFWTDARSVHILHCSGGVLGAPPLYRVGADFYYGVGGVFLPECRSAGTPYNVGICSHLRCRTLFYESLTNFNISFGTYCNTFLDYEAGSCFWRAAEVAGFFSGKNLLGMYFVEKYPFRTSYNSKIGEWF